MADLEQAGQSAGCPLHRYISDCHAGITIRDRLRVLMPNDAGNYYRFLDIVPPDLMPELGKAKIVITNFHSFLMREHTSAGKLTKSLLIGKGDTNLEIRTHRPRSVEHATSLIGVRGRVLCTRDRLV